MTVDRQRGGALAAIRVGAIGVALAVFALPKAVPWIARRPVDPEAWWWVGPKLEGHLQDQIIRLAPPAPERSDLRFVGIDAGSLAARFTPGEIAETPVLGLLEQGWPWSREVHAVVAERLIQAGARLVVFDLLFGSAREGDDALRAVLERYPDRIVLGANLTPGLLSQDAPVPAMFQGVSRTLLPGGGVSDPRVGSVNFLPETHGTIWRVPFRLTLSEIDGGTPYRGEEEYPTLTARVLERSGVAPPLGMRSAWFRYQRSDAYRPIPVIELLDPRLWQRNHGGGATFRDTIVVIGPAAREFQDFHATPHGDREGPRLHLHAIGAALQGAWFRVAGGGSAVALSALAAWGGLLPAIRLRARPITGLVLILAGAVVYFWVACAVYGFGHVLLPVAAPLLVWLLAGVFGIGYEFSVEQREKARVRRIFESYVSRDVARAILDNRDEVMQVLGGSRRPMALLFSDLRGFTALSEQADPVELVNQLNEYLGAMVEIVFRHNGTLDKFIGDAVMGVWGNLVSEGPAEDAGRAVRAALDMRATLARLNERWRSEGRREFEFGIGLHHGEAVFGNIGSEQKKEPTAIGDAVNLASRLEGVTKFCGVDVVLSRAVERLVRDRFRLVPLGALRVAGRLQAVEIFWPAGEVSDALGPEWAAFEEGLRLYRARRFAEARARFDSHPPSAPAARLAVLYASRCEAFAKDPPGPEWDGSEVMGSK